MEMTRAFFATRQEQAFIRGNALPMTSGFKTFAQPEFKGG